MDIIITGKQGSGKSDFAHENFSANYDIKDEMPLEDIFKDATRLPYQNNRVYITQDPVDTSLGNRRFIVIKMLEE